MLKNRLFNNPVIEVLFYTQFSLIFFSSMLVFTTRSMLFFLLIWFLASNQLSTSVPLLGLARGLPIILLAFLGGYIADRFNRKYISMIGHFMKACPVIYLVYSYFYAQLEVWHAFMIFIVQGMVWAMDHPSRRLLILDIVGKNRVTTGVSLDLVMVSFGSIFGPILAALFLKNFDYGWTFLIIAVCLLLATLLVGFVKQPESIQEKLKEYSVKKQLQNFASSFKDAFLYVKNSYILTSVLVFSLLFSIFVFPAGELHIIIAKEALIEDVVLTGIIVSASGIGAIIGMIVIAFLKTTRYHWTIFFSGFCGVFLSLLLLVLSKNAYFIFFALFVYGFTLSGMNIMQHTLILLKATEDNRGKIISFMGFIGGLVVLGSLMMYFLMKIFPLENSARYAVGTSALIGIGFFLIYYLIIKIKGNKQKDTIESI